MRERTCQGTVRRATTDDAAAFSRLMACVGTDVLPLIAADLETHLRRGPLLLLDLGSGTLGAAAHVVVDDTGRAMFRYVAVDPALAGTGVAEHMTAAMFALEDQARRLAIPEQPCVPRFDLTRRAGYLVLMLCCLPRVIARTGTDGPVVAMFVWSALALLFAIKTPRIPKAIVRRPRAARPWLDAALLRFGELPISAYGHPAQLPWRLSSVSPSPTPPEPRA